MKRIFSYVKWYINVIIIKRLEVMFWKIAKFLIRNSYGADCETSDLDEYPELYKEPKNVFLQSRCASCRAKEIIDWIEMHIRLLEM